MPLNQAAGLAKSSTLFTGGLGGFMAGMSADVRGIRLARGSDDAALPIDVHWGRVRRAVPSAACRARVRRLTQLEGEFNLGTIEV